MITVPLNSSNGDVELAFDVARSPQFLVAAEAHAPTGVNVFGMSARITSLIRVSVNGDWVRTDAHLQRIWIMVERT